MANINNCRVCGNQFFPGPLLQYENMPKSAQYLPDQDQMENDQGTALDVWQCSGCGLVQLSSEPVPYYQEVIRAAAISAEMGSFRKQQFKDFVNDHSLHNKKVIEIGCGGGEYLSIMQQAGVDAYGLEGSDTLVEQGIKSGLKVAKGFIANDQEKLAGAPFQAFFMLNFLEHLPQPNLTIRGIWHNLAEDAVGIVEVPNFNMILGKRLFAEFIADHLLYFTKSTLSQTLNYNGFEVLRCQAIWHDYIISAVVKKRPRLDVRDFYQYQSRLKKSIEDYLSGFGPNKVAIWGASHQALAIIALTDIADKIKYLVDSSSFKQDRYTPATHLPIYSPDRLLNDPVEGIIVMAASYSDEVARIIRQKYGKNINISILRDFGLEVY